MDAPPVIVERLIGGVCIVSFDSRLAKFTTVYVRWVVFLLGWSTAVYIRQPCAIAERPNPYLERYRPAQERVIELERLKFERQSKSWAFEKVKIMSDGRLVFQFKDDTELEGS
ncbi:MAG: hypothetical protein DDT31_01861 [Syntrophomonadaceae bacterium]|nr:hypothetical protein [Bacillota bacterium]